MNRVEYTDGARWAGDGRWIDERVRHEQVEKYLDDGGDFIDAAGLDELMEGICEPDAERVRELIGKALEIESLNPAEAAVLLGVRDEELWREMEEAAAQVKRYVYDNRIVTFAPLYLSNYCVNNCVYCGFRSSNKACIRKRLSIDEVRRETEVLAGRIGHKRLIVVYGEHPKTDVDYIASTIRAIYDVKVATRNGTGQIRRVNVNAAPMAVEQLRQLREVGLGTFQVFQETYHKGTYRRVHPVNTVKGDYLWRLTAMHRAMEAGVDDVGIGCLFGLYDWRYEVLGLVAHAVELERVFGVGPHTISFPRLEPAVNTPFAEKSKWAVSEADLRKIVTVLRLAVPYTGMILTARENEKTRSEILPLGCTQTDASSCIGIGGYVAMLDEQDDTQQFRLGDTRSLDELVRELATKGWITSFCTAGYRCGRTGEKIMNLLRCGKEGKFCKLNAVITFREWLDDFASDETKAVGEELIRREIAEIREQMPAVYPKLLEFYKRTEQGQRDLFF